MAKRLAKGSGSGGLSREEISAMKETLEERKAGKGNDEGAVLAKIAEMKEPDRRMAEKAHAIVKKAAPTLSPKTWYGMPAYADGDKVICFFQPAGKFKWRYSTLGFSDRASLDEGDLGRPRLLLRDRPAVGQRGQPLEEPERRRTPPGRERHRDRARKGVGRALSIEVEGVAGELCQEV
ncbi:MAG: hypothetical protein JRN59_00400 [Nitrososphaerota archaeon]|jgi:uncharacterized protein YdhG (YjbR/CyaY superfamily)|nr:hypothetical protein [Nitrososphaerota archaeon]